MIKAVLFDLDGTLIDTLDVDVLLINELLEKFGYKTRSRAAFRQLKGLPRREEIIALSGEKSKEKIDEMYNFTTTQTYPIGLVKLERGAIKALAELAADYPLAIVSAKAKERIELILSRFKMKRYFRAVLGRADYNRRKPHPESLLLAARLLKVNPKQCAYVGDDKVDVDAARNAKMFSVYYSKARNVKADATTDSLIKISSIMADL